MTGRISCSKYNFALYIHLLPELKFYRIYFEFYFFNVHRIAFRNNNIAFRNNNFPKFYSIYDKVIIFSIV